MEPRVAATGEREKEENDGYTERDGAQRRDRR